jgi:peptidoglycan/xylan/chitin deacetylase (PgdA/CDA1 family)
MSALRYPLRVLLTVSLLVLLSTTDTSSEDQAEDTSKGPTRYMCITFDQLPVTSAFAAVDRQAVTDRILATLENHEVTATGFVVGENINGGFDLLGDWLNNGHVLGNQTMSHVDLHDVNPQTFLDQIKAGAEALEPMLEGFGQKKRYFRYPFLHYGTTVATKREVRRYLAGEGYVIGHATIVVDDYLYDLSLENLGEVPDSLALDHIGNDYIDHVLMQVDRAEGMAMKVLKRPCNQILALKANRLNSIVLDALLTELEERGYQFVSLDMALKDDVYEAPEAYFGPESLGYVERIMRSDPDLLPAQ